LTEHRDNFARYMKGNGIYCTFRYYPLNEIDIFKDTSQIGLMDGTNIFASQALNIPIHHNLTDDNIERICESLASYGKLE
jgi:dTDP-4-amino-4,6-dideoxygalactose transaminase